MVEKLFYKGNLYDGNIAGIARPRRFANLRWGAKLFAETWVFRSARRILRLKYPKIEEPLTETIMLTYNTRAFRDKLFHKWKRAASNYSAAERCAGCLSAGKEAEEYFASQKESCLEKLARDR